MNPQMLVISISSQFEKVFAIIVLTTNKGVKMALQGGFSPFDFIFFPTSIFPLIT